MPLKVLTHRMKLKKFSNVVLPPDVKAIVEEYDLLPLVDCSLTVLDG